MIGQGLDRKLGIAFTVSARHLGRQYIFGAAWSSSTPPSEARIAVSAFSTRSDRQSSKIR